VDIPDELYRQIKARAALQGCSVKQLILRGVEAELEGRKSVTTGHRVALPLVEAKRPGRLKITNAQIDEILFP
jgi:hypothetical protein